MQAKRRRKPAFTWGAVPIQDKENSSTNVYSWPKMHSKFAHLFWPSIRHKIQVKHDALGAPPSWGTLTFTATHLSLCSGILRAQKTLWICGERCLLLSDGEGSKVSESSIWRRSGVVQNQSGKNQMAI
jgi:hypothetical protein